MIQITSNDIDTEFIGLDEFIEKDRNFNINIEHQFLGDEAEELKNQILQAQRLLDLVTNTTIDMTERERSLLNLLLEQSRETKTQENQS